jgi:hypothetical protein
MESTMEDIMKLCDVIRETGFAIHRYHKHGHLENVYENALAHRLRKLRLDVKQQYPLRVYDEDGTIIGDYCESVLDIQRERVSGLMHPWDISLEPLRLQSLFLFGHLEAFPASRDVWPRWARNRLMRQCPMRHQCDIKATPKRVDSQRIGTPLRP